MYKGKIDKKKPQLYDLNATKNQNWGSFFMQNNNSIEQNKQQAEETLKDISKNGKERPWREKKIDNLKYAEYLEVLKFKKAFNVKDCAEVLEFKPTDTGHLKLYRTWFCKSKLCPLCNWRKSMRQTNQTIQILEEIIKRHPTARFLFLTLTTKNAVDGSDLKNKLTEMTNAFNKLMKYKKINKNLIGFLRTTEVTVNKKDGTYNQHMHVLICVNQKFFRGKENYINQKEWTEFWKRALKINYTPIVHVQSVKENKKKDTEIISAIKETAKYSVKSADYLKNNFEKNLKVVEDLEIGLHAKRLISYGKLFKTVHKELNLEDEENLNLIQTDDKDEISDEEILANSIVAKWNYKKQNYFYEK